MPESQGQNVALTVLYVPTSLDQNFLAVEFGCCAQSFPVCDCNEPLPWKVERDPKAKMLYLQSFLRKGVWLGYVGLNSNLKDLKALPYSGWPTIRVRQGHLVQAVSLYGPT